MKCDCNKIIFNFSFSRTTKKLGKGVDIVSEKIYIGKCAVERAEARDTGQNLDKSIV